MFLMGSLLATCLNLLLAYPALAHQLSTDGSYSVTMHINPYDDPKLNDPSTLLFEINDSSNKYQDANCDCDIAISLNGKTLASGPLQPYKDSQPSIFSLSFPFTFAQKADYNVEVTGQPKQSGQFSGFKVGFVATAGVSTFARYEDIVQDSLHLEHWEHFSHFILFGGLIAYCSFLIINEKLKLRRLATVIGESKS